MVTLLRHSDRVARKQYRCGMCERVIKVGERHHVSTNLYDGRVYDWRECLPCDRDGIVTYVHDWTGGWHDEGVGFEQADEWADEAILWPRRWSTRLPNVSITAAERIAARNWLARVYGGEGE